MLFVLGVEAVRFKTTKFCSFPDIAYFARRENHQRSLIYIFLKISMSHISLMQRWVILPGCLVARGLGQALLLSVLLPMSGASAQTISPAVNDLPPIPPLACGSDNPVLQWRQTYQMAHRAKQQQLQAAMTAPSDAIVITPGTSIQAIVDQSPPGTAFLLKAGTHRMQGIQPKTGMKFFGEIINGERRTVLNGSRLLTQFSPSSRIYAARNLPATGQTVGQMKSGFARGAYSQDLLINQVPMRHVSRKGDVKPGTWFYDYGTQTVFIGDNPAGKTVELTTTPIAFAPTAADVTVANLVIEKYANPAQIAAIGGGREAGLGIARNWVVQGNEVRLNHGVGLRVQDGGRAIGNYVHRNGQMGVAANGLGALLEYNEVANNNFAKFDPGWEAGGSKFAFTTDLVTRRNLLYGNDGPGLWTDIDNRNTEHAENVIYNNTSSGIFHEISYAATIRDNYVANNGRDTTAWLYGSNILVSTSQDVVVRNNTIEVSAGFGNGIGVIWQSRGTQYSGERNQVTGNTIRYHGAAGRSGVATDVAAAQSVFVSNQMNGNRYYVPQANVGYRYEWQNQQVRFAQLRNFGQEAIGQETFCP
ncbi:MAG: hypothetical protein RLZZ511_2834 [Cyanobacteriota bacterium]|jgi:hypothetical protein